VRKPLSAGFVKGAEQRKSCHHLIQTGGVQVKDLKGRRVDPMQWRGLGLAESFDNALGVDHPTDEEDLAVFGEEALQVGGHALFSADVQRVVLDLLLPDGSKGFVVELRTDFVECIRVGNRIPKRRVCLFQVDVHEMYRDPQFQCRTGSLCEGIHRFYGQIGGPPRGVFE
jgi:hypothetical protein